MGLEAHIICGESGACKYCGYETVLLDSYGEFACAICEAMHSGFPLSQEAMRMYRGFVNPRPSSASKLSPAQQKLRRLLGLEAMTETQGDDEDDETAT